MCSGWLPSTYTPRPRPRRALVDESARAWARVERGRADRDSQLRAGWSRAAGMSVALAKPESMLAADRLFRRSDSTPTESLEWTIALGRGVIGAETHTLAVVGPNELRASFEADHVFT